eukprot:scaffold29246_cov66-Phaeocystis_antarctica.AAC.8
MHVREALPLDKELQLGPRLCSGADELAGSHCPQLAIRVITAPLVGRLAILLGVPRAYEEDPLDITQRLAETRLIARLAHPARPARLVRLAARLACSRMRSPAARYRQRPRSWAHQALVSPAPLVALVHPPGRGLGPVHPPPVRLVVAVEDDVKSPRLTEVADHAQRRLELGLELGRRWLGRRMLRRLVRRRCDRARLRLWLRRLRGLRPRRAEGQLVVVVDIMFMLVPHADPTANDCARCGALEVLVTSRGVTHGKAELAAEKACLSRSGRRRGGPQQ